ncbi:MAG: hypothetical protein C0432_06285 [Candidatus Puniceispirillum sp.]|nr:hypothetical protein [Candidatus Puniceispirillum sp.]
MSSKIAVISIINLKHSSLLNIYTDYLIEEGIDYDIIYYDRYGIVENSSAEKIYKYSNPFHNNMNPLQKVYHYYKFRGFVAKILKENSYNQLIIWNSFTAYLVADIVLRKYRGKYILNIRDYGFEKFKLVYSLMNILIKKSKLTTYSSPGFLEFLPYDNNQDKLLFINSYKNLEIEPKKTFKKNKPINIGFIGNVRFINNDIKLLNVFKNDSRFMVSFYGTNSEILQEYCENNDIFNVNFEGPFPVEKTEFHLNNIDVMNNLYGYGSVALDTAVSIKYYHALTKAIPILVYEGTYMEKFCTNKFVVQRNYDESFKDELFNWYTNLKVDQLNENAKTHLLNIKNENDQALKRIHSSIKKDMK